MSTTAWPAPWDWFGLALFDSSGPPPPPPPPSLPYWSAGPTAFGVQIHKLNDLATFAAVKNAGFTHGVRSTVRQGAVYGWVYGKGTTPNWGYLDNLFANCVVSPARVHLIFAYEDLAGGLPVATLAHFAAEVATRYKDQNPIFEVFNEVNIRWPFLQTPMSGAYYCSVALPLVDAIRSVLPNATIVTAGTSGAVDTGFVGGLVTAGAFAPGKFNGCGIHPYGQTASSLVAAYGVLKGLLGETPVYATEYGDNQTGAPTMLPFYNLHVAMGCPEFVWYELQNDSPIVNYGLLDFNGAQTPAFSTAQKVNALV